MSRHVTDKKILRQIKQHLAAAERYIARGYAHLVDSGLVDSHVIIVARTPGTDDWHCRSEPLAEILGEYPSGREPLLDMISRPHPEGHAWLLYVDAADDGKCAILALHSYGGPRVVRFYGHARRPS